MSIAYLLIPLGIVLMAVAAAAFFWAVDHGQFDDLEEAARSVLGDDEAQDNGPVH